MLVVFKNLFTLVNDIIKKDLSGLRIITRNPLIYRDDITILVSINYRHPYSQGPKSRTTAIKPKEIYTFLNI